MSNFSVTNIFIANTSARAAQVNQNFTDVLNILQDNHHDPNIYAGAKPITTSGIAPNAEIKDTQLRSPVTRSGLINDSAIQMITVPKGGTGLAGFATGDMFYAVDSTHLARLAIGSIGLVLTVSAGSLPTWGSSIPSYLSQNFTAGGAIASGGQPLSMVPVHSDGGPKIDTKATFTTTTTSITIAANSNRALVVHVYTAGSAYTISGATFNGVAMTQIGSAYTFNANTNNYAYTFYLANPASGTSNLVITVSGSTVVGDYYSVYNVAQTSPEASNVVQDSRGFGQTSPVTKTVTTIANGSLVIGSWFTPNTGTSFTGDCSYENTLTNTMLKSGDSSAVYPNGTVVGVTTGTLEAVTGIASLVSLAPANAPALQVVLSSSANSTNQYYNLYDTFVGFSNTGASAGQTVLTIINGICSAITGLSSTPKRYYLNDTAGTIGTTAGTNTRKVGISLSTTSILTTNIW
jgi:hypothetical protein